jgi:hypothetical protein
LRVDLDPAVPRECISQDPAVLSQRICVPFGAELMKQLRRALDIGEEERDCARGEVASHAAMMRPREGCGTSNAVRQTTAEESRASLSA